MSSPGAVDEKVRPSGWWYALVAVLWIASAVVFFLVAVKPVVDVISTGTTCVQLTATPYRSTTTASPSTVRRSTAPRRPASSPTSRVDVITMEDFGDDSYSYDFNDGPKMEALASTPDDLAGRHLHRRV